jgi:16S rRNA (uracil1498-N3)-methyltransferase
MQRYFAKKINENIILSENDIFHIQKVMRSKIGDKFQVVVDNEAFYAEITSFNPFSFKIIEKINNSPELDGYIRLLYCLPKGEKLDLVIQKAVELGVKEIVLVNSSRCVRKIDEKDKDKKLSRFNKIIKEASEQCKRVELMKLEDIIDYKDINKYNADKSFIAYENSDEQLSSLYEDFKDINDKTINILIGSEGGFSIEEVEYAIKCGYKSISLGKRILRSETSCFYALSLLSFFMEAKL